MDWLSAASPRIKHGGSFMHLKAYAIDEEGAAHRLGEFQHKRRTGAGNDLIVIRDSALRRSLMCVLNRCGRPRWRWKNSNPRSRRWIQSALVAGSFDGKHGISLHLVAHWE